MSKLNIDQKTVLALFQDSKNDFLIPDYQRPYAWGLEECTALWEDLYAFAFPEENPDNFNDNDEYFLGPIVTFKNDQQKLEVIDGQQRLTTLMLLMRAFYNHLQGMNGHIPDTTRNDIIKCIWKTDRHGLVKDESVLRISTHVATDNDKEEFIKILMTGQVQNKKSRYAINFEYFEGKVKEFLHKHAPYFVEFPSIILKNCVLLPIEAESQDTALRIFSTLNDRGKPLSDADIFKAQFYKYYSAQGRKDEFIGIWRDLEEVTSRIFRPASGSPLDELFIRYMYYERAKQSITSSTTEALRKFYEKENYKLLKNENTLQNLVCLADFWESVSKQDEKKFSERILKRLFVLNYAPNNMWANIVSVYFMHNKDESGNLPEEEFYDFLNKITAFIFAYAITTPGVNSLRTPIYAEMVNIVNDSSVTFSDKVFDEKQFRAIFTNHDFSNFRTITKSLLTWWAFSFEEQPLLALDTSFDIEHIYSRNRQKKEKGLTGGELESLGNKSLLERNINIGASDYRFEDKAKYFKGQVCSKGERKKTKIHELLLLADSHKDFAGDSITLRSMRMLDRFVEYLDANNLILKSL
ncbi:MAG: DUF262 domain-containing protein [Akkermansia sp.]|nr:DUF262 domain-containing protein [Akkermansia sp.]